MRAPETARSRPAANGPASNVTVADGDNLNDTRCIACGRRIWAPQSVVAGMGGRCRQSLATKSSAGEDLVVAQLGVVSTKFSRSAAASRASALRAFDGLSDAAWFDFCPRGWSSGRGAFRAAIAEGRVAAVTVERNVSIASKIAALSAEMDELYRAMRDMPVARKQPGVRRNLRAVVA